jgi:hypothetical protein
LLHLTLLDGSAQSHFVTLSQTLISGIDCEKQTYHEEEAEEQARCDLARLIESL